MRRRTAAGRELLRLGHAELYAASPFCPYLQVRVGDNGRPSEPRGAQYSNDQKGEHDR